MAKPVLYGADYSVYVRIARMALAEKGVEYDLVPVDIFAQGGPPDWYRALHPFNRIPAFEHGDVKLFETAAITRYVDEAFAGPALQPDAVRRRAIMNQMVGLLDAYAYQALVWGVYVERVSKPQSGQEADEDKIAESLTIARICLEVLDGLKAEGDFLAGGKLSLADLYAAPMVFYFTQAPEGRNMLERFPALAGWWDGISKRPSFEITTPSALKQDSA